MAIVVGVVSLRRMAPRVCVGVLGIGLLATGGCLPVAPYALEPGYYDSRSNLEAAAPDWIVPGQTTRAAVMERLGPPDLEGLDGRWAFYRSNYLETETGVWVLWAVPGAPAAAGGLAQWPRVRQMEFRRLSLAYTADGSVASVGFDRRACADVYPRSTFDFPSVDEVARCPVLGADRERQDSRRDERRRAAVPGSDTRVEWFDGVLFARVRARSMLGVNERLRCFAAGASMRMGSLAITDQSVVFLAPESRGTGSVVDATRIDRAQIVRAEAVNGLLDAALAVELSMPGSGRASFSMCTPDQSRHSAELNRRAQALLSRTARPATAVVN